MSADQLNKIDNEYSKMQLWVLVLLRLIIGYHFLFEGFNKLFNPAWTSAGFLSQSYGVFLEIVNSPSLLSIMDFVNIWGQILIGIGLIVGLFSRYAAIAAGLLLFFYYIALPPTALGNIFVDRNLLEFFGVVIIVLYPTSQVIGVDGLIKKMRMRNDG